MWIVNILSVLCMVKRGTLKKSMGLREFPCRREVKKFFGNSWQINNQKNPCFKKVFSVFGNRRLK